MSDDGIDYRQRHEDLDAARHAFKAHPSGNPGYHTGFADGCAHVRAAEPARAQRETAEAIVRRVRSAMDRFGSGVTDDVSRELDAIAREYAGNDQGGEDVENGS